MEDEANKRRSHGDIGDIEKDAELRMQVRKKMRDIEQQSEERERVIEEALAELKEVTQQMSDLNTELDNNLSSAEKLALLEKKEALLKTIDEKEANHLSVVQHYDDVAIKYTADEERVLRGMMAAKEVKSQKELQTARREEEAIKLSHRRHSTAGRATGEQEDKNTLDAAKKKQERFRAMQQEYKEALAPKEARVDQIQARVKNFKVQRRKLTGDAFKEAGKNLLIMLTELERAEDDRDAVKEKYVPLLRNAMLNSKEDRVLRGHVARQKGAKTTLDNYPTPVERDLPPMPFTPTPISDRLFKPPVRKELPALDRGPRLKRSVQTELAARLHDRELTMRREKAEQSDQKVLEILQAKSPRKVMGSDDIEALVHRVFYEGLTKEQETTKKAVEKWSEKTESRKLTVEEVKRSNNRLFYERKDKKKETHRALCEKYIGGTAPVFATLSKQQINQSIQRLASAS